MMGSRGSILLLYTGGTIGMIRDVENGALQPFDFQNLLAQIPELDQLNCHIDTDSLDSPIDSSNMGPPEWQRLASRIAESYHDYDGFVVLHGSDTMAYTASAMSFMLQNLSKPVIFTGSQLPIGIPRSDARENLLTTMEIALACNDEGGARVPEVGIYFEYDLFRGNRTHKNSTQDFEAFHSYNYPKLAEAGVHIRYHDIHIGRASTGSFTLYRDLDSRIGVLSLFPGIQPEFALPVMENPQVKVLIIRTFGSGNGLSAPWFLKGLAACIRRGTQVINVSQCNGGGVFQGQYESSRRLRELGVISGHDLTFEAASTKAMHLLGQGHTGEEFIDYFEQNIAGEMTF